MNSERLFWIQNRRSVAEPTCVNTVKSTQLLVRDEARDTYRTALRTCYSARGKTHSGLLMGSRRDPHMATSRRRPIGRKLRKETLKRRAVQAEAERELLVDAAATVFGDRGYHEASMRDIASHAGFSIGALYERFESKDALYCEVVERHFAAIWGALEQTLALPRDFRGHLVELTAVIFEHNTRNRAFLRLYGIHPPTIAEPYQSRITKMREQERSRRALVDTLKIGQRGGLLVSESAEFLGSMYYAMVLRAVNDYLADRCRLPDPERLVTLFLGGVASHDTKPAAAKRPTRARVSGALRNPPVLS